jgi:hypothetical protein
LDGHGVEHALRGLHDVLDAVHAKELTQVA